MNLSLAVMALTLVPIYTYGKLLKDDHFSTGYKTYSWAEVCKKLVKTESPLIEKAGISQLDCMGRKVKVSKFCEQKEASNPFYTRAVVVQSERAVRCYSGKKVRVKWQCDGKQDFYCRDKELGCFYFKEQLANRLTLVHASLIYGKVLNCYFDRSVDILHTGHHPEVH